VDAEGVPRLPARLVAEVARLGGPCFLYWEASHCRSTEAALITVAVEEAIVLRGEGSETRIRLISRPVPRHGGRALLLCCPRCSRLVRHLYGWARAEGRNVRRVPWLCRLCAGLRYSSEGYWTTGWRREAIRCCGRLPRFPWDPQVVEAATQGWVRSGQSSLVR
jgi:hypothetical protein